MLKYSVMLKEFYIKYFGEIQMLYTIVFYTIKYLGNKNMLIYILQWEHVWTMQYVYLFWYNLTVDQIYIAQLLLAQFHSENLALYQWFKPVKLRNENKTLISNI